MNILETTQDMNLLVRQHNTCATRVLNRELCFTVFAGDAADGAPHVLALQGLHVLDLEGLDVEVVEAEEGDGVVDVET